MKPKLLLAGLCATLAILVAWGVLSLRPRPQREVPAAPAQPAAYVGSSACKDCHAREYDAWMGSDHELAMQEATDRSVLGDFSDARFRYFDVTTRFYRRDGKFFVSTDDSSGKMHEFEVRYTFGVHPLQQYLIGFPDGRLQALSIAWDSRPRVQGGQKWFHLYPKENIRAGDELHWTGLEQNWNYMCAECHSTGLKKNYDAASNSYRTSWTDISVGCEACHGAGSAHVSWAGHGLGSARPQANDGLLVHLDDRRDVSWIRDAGSGNSHRSRPRGNIQELQICGRCHARAAKISEEWLPGAPLLNTHRVALLDEHLYSADGQMRDEVYNYGSFLQSKMFAAGVTCSDCHDPHTQRLRAGSQAVCSLCHADAKYATSAHHHHQEQSAGSRCVACHMPQRTYMGVDQRHDHSLRIPRPDESVRYGTPNACNDCHGDKPASWSAAAVVRWYGGVHPGRQQFTAALTAAHRESQEAGTLLLQLARDGTAPAIARATALSSLQPYLDGAAFAAARDALQSTDDLERLAALELLSQVDPNVRWPLLSPLLRDPVRALRVAAADALADALPSGITAEQTRAFQAALAEYTAVQTLNADRPEAHLNLGNLYRRQGKAPEAEAQYRQALALWPDFTPAYVNLADLSRERHEDEQAEGWLTAATRASPKSADVALALGLLRVRQHHLAEALPLLQKATRLAPSDAHDAYVYGVALYSSGKRAQGLEFLRRAHEKFPGNRELLLGLAGLTAESGDLKGAAGYAQAFVAMAPADPRGQQLLQQLAQSQP